MKTDELSKIPPHERDIDPTVIRLLFLILAVFGGSGLVVYLVMWIVVPDASKA